MRNLEEIALRLYQDKNEAEAQRNEVKICRDAIIEFYRSIKDALFFDYLSENCKKKDIESELKKSYEALQNSFGPLFDEYKEKIDEIYDKLPEIKEKMLLDIEAIFKGDPAADSYFEIVSTYPGFTAILAYRLSHEFYLRKMKFVARILSEYAHSRTGVDINPGAQIGKSFFIDHGTGIVIGETSIIGDNCKIYQGVTLGALSLKDGRKLKEVKRHPTLLNNVILYSGASIFGGNTIIGNNVIVGSNVEIKESIPDNTIVRGNACISR